MHYLAQQDKGGNSTQSTSSSGNRPSVSGNRSNPYRTLPPPTSAYIELRLQLCNFPGVYRVVQLPISYTFANLHILMLYLFGWGGGHEHEARVFSHAEVLDESDERHGHITRCGRLPPTPVWASEDPDYHYFAQLGEREPLYTIISRGYMRYFRGFHDVDSSKKVEDQKLALGDVWAVDNSENASKGECSNKEIVIKYLYDLGDEWEVHVTCDSNAPFCEMIPPSNEPKVITAKGAPPIEDPCEEEVRDDANPAEKAVAPEVFIQGNFSRYCTGKLGSVASKDALVVSNLSKE